MKRLACQGIMLLVLCTWGAAFADSEFEDRPVPFLPRQAPTPEELDHREALALFANARSLELQGQSAEALRKYQRAWRLDPQAVEPLRAVVPLADRMDRQDIAVRYALLMVDREKNANPVLLQKLGEELVEKGRWREGRKLLDRFLKQERDRENPNGIRLALKAGQMAFIEEDFQQAAEDFSLVMRALEHPKQFGIDELARKEIFRDLPAVYQDIGEAFLGAGKWDEAESAFRKGEEVQSNPAQWKFNQARLAARRGQPAAALALLDEALSVGLPGFGMGPYEELANVLAALRKSGELIGRLEILRQKDPENAPLGYFLAGRYRQAGRLDRADVLYAMLLEKTPTLVGYQNLAAIRRQTKNYKGLLRLLGMMIERTGFLEPLGKEEQNLADDGGVLEGLIEAARKNLAPPPDKGAFGPRLALALLSLEKQRWDVAADFFEAAAKSDPQRADQAYLDWGVGLLVAGQSARAEKVFRTAIQRKYLPDDTAMLYFYLAGALSMEDRTDEALAAAEKALKLKTHLSLEDVTSTAGQRAGSSSAPAPWWKKSMEWLHGRFSGPPVDAVRFAGRIGWVLAHGKRYDQALRTYRGVIEKFDPDYSSARLRDELKALRLDASGVAVLAGSMSEAEEWLEQVLDEYPGDPGASNDLAYLWADQNRNLQRALRMARTALAGEPENAAYRDSLGWTLFRLGDTKESIVELQKAAAGRPDGEVLDHLGDAYRAAGRPDDARGAWQKAAEAYRKDKKPEMAEAVQKKIK
jgi:tetratricopeptide (TPR) repeat protein